jgi:uncharacterized protein (DUF4415 family)
MTGQPKKTDFRPGRGYSKTDWDAVSDTPEVTAEELAQARPFDLVFPDQAASARRMRGPQKAPLKTRVTLRIDSATLEAFKATGKGWQTRMDAALKAAAPSRKN